MNKDPELKITFLSRFPVPPSPPRAPESLGCRPPPWRAFQRRNESSPALPREREKEARGAAPAFRASLLNPSFVRRRQTGIAGRRRRPAGLGRAPRQRPELACWGAGGRGEPQEAADAGSAGPSAADARPPRCLGPPRPRRLARPHRASPAPGATPWKLPPWDASRWVGLQTWLPGVPLGRAPRPRLPAGGGVHVRHQGVSPGHLSPREAGDVPVLGKSGQVAGRSR